MDNLISTSTHFDWGRYLDILNIHVLTVQEFTVNANLIKQVELVLSNNSFNYKHPN